MSKKILVYEMSDTRFEALKKTLRPLGVSVYKVAKSQYGDPIGELALGKAGQKAVGTVQSHTNIPGAAPIPECHVLVRCLYLVGFPVRRWMLY